MATFGDVISRCYGSTTYNDGYRAGVLYGDLYKKLLTDADAIQATSDINDEWERGYRDANKDKRDISFAQWLIASAWADGRSPKSTANYIARYASDEDIIEQCFGVAEDSIWEFHTLPAKAYPWLRGVRDALVGVHISR